MEPIATAEILKGAALIMNVTEEDLKETLNIVRSLGGDAKRMIAEIYSPPRVTAAARKLPHLGIVPGFAMDLRTGWDFDNAERRREARRRVATEQPMFVVTSPECRAWSSWQQLNAQKRNPADVERDRVRARLHLAFVTELHADQVRAGRYFLHEHPA